MTNEEFQKLVLEKLINLENGQKNLETKIDKLDVKVEQYGNEQQKDVLKLLELNSKKIDRLDAKFDILNHRVFEQEADIQLLKKAK